MIVLDDIFAARAFVMKNSHEYPAVRAKLIYWPKWKLRKWKASWDIINKTVNANYMQFIALTRKEEAGPRVKLTVKNEEEPTIINGSPAGPIPATERLDSTKRIPEPIGGETIGH